MKAILLAAGYGSRLRPLTEVFPKCLLPINGYPLLQYWFELLLAANISPILVNLHYLSDIMQEWILQTEYADKIKMVYEESLLGTGGTLLQNRDFVGNEPVILIHADNLSYFDPIAFIKAHKNRPKNAKITMMTFNTSSPETCGIVKIDRDGIVKEFYEKAKNPPGNLANAAVYIIEPEVIDYLASLSKTTIDFSTEVLPFFIEQGQVYTYHNNNYHRDIGVIESYLESQIDFPFEMIKWQKNGSWSSFLKRKGFSFYERFVSSLSNALLAEVIYIEEINKTCKGGLEKDKKYILYCPDADKYLNIFIDPANDKYLKDAILIVFFHRASGFFSSRWLYEKTGLKSLIFYRVD